MSVLFCIWVANRCTIFTNGWNVWTFSVLILSEWLLKAWPLLLLAINTALVISFGFTPNGNLRQCIQNVLTWLITLRYILHYRVAWVWQCVEFFFAQLPTRPTSYFVVVFCLELMILFLFVNWGIDRRLSRKQRFLSFFLLVIRISTEGIFATFL